VSTQRFVKITLVILCAAASTHACAEEYRLGHIFAGYSLNQGDLQKKASGWELSVGKTFNRWFSLNADFDAHHQSAAGSQRHQHNLLFGPEFFHRTGRFTLFAHVFPGACRTNGTLGQQTGFAFVTGGGVDWDFGAVSVRMAQVDYHGAQLFGSWQQQARVSVGVVFHFVEFRDPGPPPPPPRKDLLQEHFVHRQSASGLSPQ